MARLLLAWLALCSARQLPTVRRPSAGRSAVLRGGGDAEAAVDEALYSRQLYVMGHAAQHSLSRSTVLLLGLSGLGAEVAKNLALAGIKELHVHDDSAATMHDLASSFLLSESDVGTPRAARAVEQLAPLNPHVVVRRVEGPVDEAALRAGGYTCVVAVDRPLEEQQTLDDASRAVGARFVSCSSRGVFGSVFCDLGDKFTSTDADGEPPREALLERVAPAAETGEAEVTTVAEQPHGLSDGDTVRFAEAEGVPALCAEGATFTVRVIGRHTLRLVGTPHASLGGAHERGGRLVQLKTAQQHGFVRLREAVAQHKRLAEAPAGSPPRRAATVHACFCCIDEVLAAAHAAADAAADDDTLADALLAAVRASGLVEPERVEEATVAAFARGAAGALSPVAAFVGGVAAQEVLKACTGRFTPLRQFGYFDWLEALPTPPPSAAERAPRGDRYDGQRAVVGDGVQRALGRARYFVVGAGAIGCELLKCLALMGVGVDAAGGGALHVTDMDDISTSNLNRQFLFRPADVGRPKAAVAARAVAAINPQLAPPQLAHHEKPVGDAATFGDAFWRGLDGVLNALDNVEARRFVDAQCVRHSLPLLDSGTHGVKGSTQAVLPHLSESYGASADPPEETIPVCTLKSFPYAIEHALQWARDAFEGAFAHTPSMVNRFLASPRPTLRQLESGEDEAAPDGAQDAMAALHAAVVQRPADGAGCVAWAVGCFRRWFDADVRRLLAQYPPDHVADDGAPFWGGTRRTPTPAAFDAAEPTHRAFVAAAAALRAASLGVAPPSDADLAPDALEAAAAAAAAAADADADAAAAAAADGKGEDEAALRARRRKELLAHAGDGRLPRWSGAPQTFEKDDDANGHVAFVTAAANLRATNFAIARCDAHTAKRVAGKIVPAIATTTAAVVGLVGMELLKLQRRPGDAPRPLSDFRNGFVNLALPLFALSEPNPAEERALPGGEVFTEWSSLPVAEAEAPTLGALVRVLEARLGSEVSFVTYRGLTLYSSLTPPANQRAYLQMGVRDAATAVVTGGGGGGGGGSGSDAPPPSGSVLLHASVYDEEAEEDVEAPAVVWGPAGGGDAASAGASAGSVARA